MTQILIETIMRTGDATLLPETPIRRAVALLGENSAAAAPVLDEDGHLVGILTEKDCFRSALNASYYQEWVGTVADHMTADLVTIGAGEDLTVAAEMFLEKPYHVFPVVVESVYLGMLHRSDVLAALSRAG